MYKETKPMLNTDDLIEHLDSKGVKFVLIKKDDAIKYLKENNNYFKLVSYRKNFDKIEYGINKGKYINLDFKMLMDLSIIDMRLRKSLLSIVLDVEHYAKVRLLSKIENTTKDGYSIVEEYINDLKKNGYYHILKNELDRKMASTYCGDLISKYHDEFPVWVFVEVISFGQFINFYKFVADKYKDRKMIDEYYLLMDVRELRNACAHNNCILNDLHSNTSVYKANYDIQSSLSQVGISKKIRDNKLSNTRLKQITTLLYLSKRITTSKGVFEHQKVILQELKSRIEEHIDYYKSNDLVYSSLSFMIKLVDNWYI